MNHQRTVLLPYFLIFRLFLFTSYLFVFFCLSLRACCIGFTLKCLPCICAIIKQNEINVLFRWRFLVNFFFSYWNFKIRFFKKPIFYNYVLIYMYKLKLITYTNYTSTCTHNVTHCSSFNGGICIYKYSRVLIKHEELIFM